MLISRLKSLTLAAALLAGLVTEANASDNLFQQFVGNYGVSTAGWGSLSQTGTISIDVPVGSTVTGAWLYSSTFGQPSEGTPGGTLGGTVVDYNTALGANPDVTSLEAFRADVTGIVAPVVNGGLGGTYNFSITETQPEQDGEALVVVYSNPTLPTQTVGILNGAQASSGDHNSITFASPLDPSAPGFFAHMAIGDGFSCCGQASEIDVNGSPMTTVAGNNDSCVDSGAPANGCLITVGNINGPFTGGTPGSPQNVYADDHEAYDLAPFISTGDTAISIDTNNPSHDDLIFLQVFDVSGEGSIVGPTVPETSTWAMMIIGFAGLGFVGYRTSKKKQTAALAAA